MDDDAVDVWWTELPKVERRAVLRLPPDVPLPEDLVVGLLLSGFRVPPGTSPAERLRQPTALLHLIGRENAWRAEAEAARSTPDQQSCAAPDPAAQAATRPRDVPHDRS